VKKEENPDFANALLCLFAASRASLNEGMKILGLRPLKKM
jgi:arginyl-tRNA synthetase